MMLYDTKQVLVLCVRGNMLLLVSKTLIFLKMEIPS